MAPGSTGRTSSGTMMRPLKSSSTAREVSVWRSTFPFCHVCFPPSFFFFCCLSLRWVSQVLRRLLLGPRQGPVSDLWVWPFPFPSSLPVSRQPHANSALLACLPQWPRRCARRSVTTAVLGQARGTAVTSNVQQVVKALWTLTVL